MAKRVGRPSLYKPEFAEQARKFCLLGATNARLAELLGVGGSTLDEWIAGKPEFAEAVHAGRVVANAEVAHSLYRRAIGYEHQAVKIFMVDETVTEVIDGETVVTKTKRERYVPYTERFPPDTLAGIYWLNNRERENWRQKVEHQHSVDDELLAALDAATERAKKR